MKIDYSKEKEVTEAEIQQIGQISLTAGSGRYDNIIELLESCKDLAASMVLSNKGMGEKDISAISKSIETNINIALVLINGHYDNKEIVEESKTT